jgi:hypothetical protein
VLALLLAAAPALAATPFEGDAVKALAGRDVLLLVGPTAATKAQKTHYWELLKRSGADMKRYPVYQTAALPADLASKLGLAKRAPGYAALVRWGDPARFGPARVLEPGVLTELSTDADIYVLVEEALTANGQQELLDRLPEDMRALIPHPELSIEQVDFQANGTPHFLVATKVRVKNSGKVAARGVIVIYQVENSADGSWFELGRQGNLVIKAGQTITRDLVRSTHDTPLLNAKNEIQPTRYRIRVESPEGTLEATDRFTPLEIEQQD